MAIPISVLYVDDESALLDVSKAYLERTHEFAVTTATSAPAALELIKSNGIQAIVSDYQMPGMDGIEFLKKLRATEKNLPFILFTGKGREEVAIQAFENGADSYLQKGGDPKSQFAELMHKIKEAVEHRHADMQVKTLNRLYSVLSATSQAIIRIHDKKELLNEICRISVDTGGFVMAWAGLVNPKNHTLETVATYGQSNGFMDKIAISTDDIPLGQGPTGTAFREKKFNVCNDIATDAKKAPWCKGALERGYQSVAAFPFAADTKNAGVITFYASEPGFFNDQIIRLLDEQSRDISFAFVTLEHDEEKMAVEDELKKSELQYRRLFETAQDAILILDGDTGEIIDANKFIIDMLGYPLVYFIGRHLWELGFIKDKYIAQHAFAELTTKGYIRYDDLPLETKDGQSMAVEFVSNVYFVGDKRIIQCNIRDITGRKSVQDALLASERRYRRLFETAQDGILILDEETGMILDANKCILDMLIYPLEYFIGKRLWELGFIKDKSFAQRAFTELKTNGSIRYDDLPLERKDGQSIDVEFISNVYPVNDHKIVQCNIRNITQRKRAESALALAIRKLTLLSSITRHDIRNQLLALEGYLELSKGSLSDPVKTGEFVAKEEKIAENIGHQIDFTKDYEDMGVNAPVWQDVHRIIRKVVGTLPMRTIRVEADGPVLEVFADPLLEKVFYNLIDNALRYGGEQMTAIRMTALEENQKLVIAVKDDGNGISDEDKKHLFNKGFGRHTGLGLFLSREILSITGITITETGVPGKGAQFEMTVPDGAWRFP
ncbi:MAG: PAS domain S-box protein [Methanoregula sp.]